MCVNINRINVCKPNLTLACLFNLANFVLLKLVIPCTDTIQTHFNDYTSSDTGSLIGCAKQKGGV